MNENIKVYAENSLMDLFRVIDGWNKDKLEKVTISLEDLTLMKNHIEDLEQEVYGTFETENTDVK